jgi:pimeloyl-ACP methyl ester carboxylesterase
LPGRRIPIQVVVLKATGNAPQPDALVPLQGGPGQAGTPLAVMFSRLFADVRRERDIVLVDVRGTGKSNPLYCDIASPPWTRSLDLMPPDAIRGCRDALQQRADLRSYTTDIIAKDLDDIRIALGIERWNVFGASYGTRLAQEYTRRFGAHVRTLTLHGIAAPSMAIPLPYARDAQQAIDKLLDVPTRATLERVLKQLTRQPAVVSTGSGDVAVSAGELSEALRNMLYNARSAAAATAMITAASNGDYRAAAEAVMRQREGFSTDIALGMFLSVTCTEDIPRITEEAIAENTRNTFLGDYRVRQQMTACRTWFTDPIAAADTSPLRSDVPALLISGEVDPVTPPTNGEEVARTLPNARHVVIPGHGHTMSLAHPCINAALRRFLDTANARALDLSCLQ